MSHINIVFKLKRNRGIIIYATIVYVVSNTIETCEGNTISSMYDCDSTMNDIIM